MAILLIEEGSIAVGVAADFDSIRLLRSPGNVRLLRSAFHRSSLLRMPSAYGMSHSTVERGIAGFQYCQRWRNVARGWHMRFAWVAPEWRRREVLSRRWPAWREVHGEFTLEYPLRLSEAMHAFLANVGHPAEPTIIAAK
jgi:hypothetical protein